MMLLCAVLCNARAACKAVTMQASGEKKSGVDRVAAKRDFLESGG